MTTTQTAAVGAIDSLLQSRVQAVTDARNALGQAALANRADINARAEALAAAEQSLAQARADAFTLLQSTNDRLTAVQVQAIASSAATNGTLIAPAAAAGGGGGGGGRGGGGLNLAGGPNLSDAAYANRDAIFPKSEPVKRLAPEDQLKKFILQPGYKIENVLADPDIKEPTNVAFDGNGRMFVLEDRTYLLNIDAKGQYDPISRISLHVDKDNDGVYETHSVFVDNLVFPRSLLPFGPNAVLTMEHDQDEVWKYTDTNGDGKADKKELFAAGYGAAGDIEHEPSSLLWTMDNWMYTTMKGSRSRWTPTGVLREPTGNTGGQWGVAQDNDGKQWIQGGLSGVPQYFQFPVVYGIVNIGTQWDSDFTIPWGAPVRIADMQGGLTQTRMPDGSLNRVTGAAGSEVVRAHRMPADLQGEYLYGEPVGRIVRRIHPMLNEGLTTLKNAYEGNEFVKSTDPLFRPVEMANAPDGTVYLVDMYRGIIQDAPWSQPLDTYLRARVDQYQLDKLHSMGRVWRLSYEATPRDKTVPKMNTESAAQLVTHLSHPNGWWRDTAQQLLILKQDKSVVPALKKLVTTKGKDETGLLARFHALWTLEGLGSLDAKLTREMLADAEPRMRSQAIRASETLYKAGDKSFAADYAKLANDADTNVAIQAMLTMNTLKVPAAAEIARAKQSSAIRGIQVVSNYVINPNAGGGGRGGGGPGGGAGVAAATVNLGADQPAYDRGEAVYNALCFNCHATNGLGQPKDGGGLLGAPLAGSSRVLGHRDYVVSVLLNGLKGPIPGTELNDVMPPFGTNSDQWIADLATYIRNAFGNAAGAVKPEQVAQLRAASSGRTQNQAWTVAELDARMPRQVVQFANFSASLNEAGARNAVSTITSWNVTGAQPAGPVWLQIELESAASVSEVQFNVGAPGGRGFGGGGGRGGAAAGGRGGAPAAEGLPVALPGAPVATPAVAPAGGATRTFRVEVSSNGTTWTPVGTATGGNGLTTVVINRPVAAKFVRISQVEGASNYALSSLRIYDASTAR